MLEELRKEFDAIDAIIIKKLNERFDLLKKIEKHKTSLIDKNRESQILGKIKSEYIQDVYGTVFKNSNKLMKKIREDRILNQPNKLLFYSYNDHLKKLFNCRVYKVSIDAGFTCPNRDGSKGVGGCTFCDETGSSSRLNTIETPIREQVLNNIKVRRSRFKSGKFIAYFQSNTNTYAPVEQLQKLYDEAVDAHPDIVGLAISTREDCIDEEKIALISSYRERLPYVSVEYGMQTIHDRTLASINRCSKHSDFLRALELTQKYDLDYCVHVILGLPGESREDQLKTAEALAKMGVRGVKIHLLVAMDKTPLAKSYERGKWSPLSFEEYVSLVCDFIERLPSNCVIHRLSGNGHPLHVVAPKWMSQRKGEVIKAISQTLINRKTYQGFRYPE